ncbi:MAG: hypothetical protein JWR80_9609 [Bradyrhizobium sp.]|nr:hypothetical protein [Bradyrhizobium sp.]
MLHLFVDTCVWLDMAKDYRHQPTLAALEEMIEAGEVTLVLPKQSIDEFARNKDRIIRDSGKSLSSTFKRVKEAVRQFGKAEGREEALASLDDVDHRITILGEAVHESESGKHKVVTEAEWKMHLKRHQKVTVDTVWQRALAAAKRTEDEVGLENLGPWSDFEWGMLNGKLSALRWVTGSEWDFLDT